MSYGSTLASNITYKPFGGMSSITYGNGLTGAIGYDNQYRITSMITGTVQNLSYGSYDANGNIIGITNDTDATKNKLFTYDALDRLATANGMWGSLGWTYDSVGNRQNETADAGTSSYAYQAGTNKLTNIAGSSATSFAFDNNGNTAIENNREYVYNQNQRLIKVSESGVVKGEYAYNGNGQRVRKTADGQVVIFHYNLNGQLIAESNSAGSVLEEYVYLSSQPLAKIEGADTYYYHNDHLGTPQKMTDSSGVVRWSADYKPFGEVNITTSDITNNLRFPGQYYDAETGLHYNYFRDYNPMIGRYIENDPIGIRKGNNHLYIYVSSNPLIYDDSFGLEKKCVKAKYYNATFADAAAHQLDKTIIRNYVYFEMPCSCNEKASSVELKIKKTSDSILSSWSSRDTFLGKVWDPYTPCGETGNMTYQMESRSAGFYGEKAVDLLELCYECVKCK